MINWLQIRQFARLSVTLPFVIGCGQRATERQLEPGAAPPLTGSLGSRLDDYLTRLVPFGFSGTVLIARRDTLLLHRSYGLAERASNVPLRPDMPFIIGSLSKQFTSAAILALEADRLLAVSDSLGRWLPEIPVDKHGITLHQLMTHTSGLPYHTNRPFLEERSRPDVYQEMAALPLEFSPGARWQYSSPGYTLLAAVIERAAGMSYEDYLTRRLFRRAGLQNTGFQSRLDWIGPHKAVHSYMDDTDEGAITAFPPAPKGVGAGSVVTTAADLYRWIQALRDGRVLPRAYAARLFLPHVARGDGRAYGYGWEIIRTIRGTTVLRHAGDINGYNAELRNYEDENVVIVLTSAVRLGGRGVREAVMNDVSRIVAGDTVSMAPRIGQATTADKMRRSTAFRSDQGTVTISSRGNALHATVRGRELVRLLGAARGDTADSAAVRFLAAEARDTFVAYDMFTHATTIASFIGETITLRLPGTGTVWSGQRGP